MVLAGTMAKRQVSAEHATLLSFNDELVGAGGEVHGGGGLEGADEIPVVEDLFAVEVDAVAGAFTGAVETTM